MAAENQIDAYNAKLTEQGYTHFHLLATNSIVPGVKTAAERIILALEQGKLPKVDDVLESMEATAEQRYSILVTLFPPEQQQSFHTN